MLPIPRFKQVFINVPANTVAGAKLPFPLVEQLRDKKIIAIEFYAASILSFTSNQVATIVAADALACEAVFKENSTERVDSIPLNTLQPVNMAGVYKQFIGFVVNWQASFVRVNTNLAAAASSIPFGFIYEE
jgi:hypothetical protein